MFYLYYIYLKLPKISHIITDFSANYWTGGYFDIKTENWIWSTGFAMPHSTPYWALRLVSCLLVCIS